MVVKDNINSEIYLGFVSGAIERMQSHCKSTGAPFILLYDNASVHKTKAVRDCIEQTGSMAILNCPYSPELNFCEQFIRLHKMTLQAPFAQLK